MIIILRNGRTGKENIIHASWNPRTLLHYESGRQLLVLRCPPFKFYSGIGGHGPLGAPVATPVIRFRHLCVSIVDLCQSASSPPSLIAVINQPLPLHISLYGFISGEQAASVLFTNCTPTYVRWRLIITSRSFRSGALACARGSDSL